MIRVIQPLIDAVLDFIYPRVCVCCNHELELDESFICQSCEDSLTYIQTPICFACGSPVFRESVERCDNCLREHIYYDQIRSELDYNDELVRQMIHAFKFEYMNSMVSGLSKYLILAYEQYYTHEQIELILSVPLHKSRLRQREFNQAHLLAKHFANEIHLPLRDDLAIRNRSTQPQSQLKPDERMKNVKDAFSILNPDEVSGKTILIIDDIVTTGSTVNEMSKVLRECGATRILVLSLARAYT